MIAGYRSIAGFARINNEWLRAQFPRRRSGIEKLNGRGADRANAIVTSSRAQRA